VRRLASFLLVALLVVSLPLAADPPTDDRRPRVVVIQVDGLSPYLLDALLEPESPEKLNRLPDPEGFRRAIELFRMQSGERDLLPNFRRYFYRGGVRAGNLYSATTTLSAIAWGVLQSGQPSVVKRHMTFNRSNGYLRGHLDGFRDGVEISLRRGRKTAALWELDQAGVSLFSDAFSPLRRYETPQIFYRLTPRDYLVGLARQYVTAGQGFSSAGRILRAQLARFVEGMDYPDMAEEFSSEHIAEKILEPDGTGREAYDFINLYLSLDHQQHVDPNPENLVHRLVRLDRRVGRILAAVEVSRRRDQTLVAVVSDHGSEYLPGNVNLAWPITRAFRTRAFGGHTVATVMAEDSGRALSTPLPFYDYPRIYESPFSPYGKSAGPGGQDGYSTAFIDNFGNARAEVHLRNNDLNRLHLLLLARRRSLEPAGRDRLRELLRATLDDLRRWLEPELAAYRDYHESVRAWLPALQRREDYYWRDAAARLAAEAKLDAPQVRALTNLQTLANAEDPLAWLEAHPWDADEFIPKRYFGPRNTVFQLSHFTIGLDANLHWIETTVDPRGRTVPMDYFSILSHYRAPNPPASGEPNPVDLIVRALPADGLRPALVARGWLEPPTELRQAIWILSTRSNDASRGGQALLLQAADGRLSYRPVRNLLQAADGNFAFEPADDLDPLGLLHDPGLGLAPGASPLGWLASFHTQQEWVDAAYATRYNLAPVVFADIAALNTPAFLANPEFQQALTGFPDDETKQRYLRGLAWKYSSQLPDLLLWSNYLWNFSSKSHTAGGSHGGLTPLVSRTAFLLWGGADFHLPAGLEVEAPGTTLDVAPTLAQLMGMLDSNRRVIRQAGAVSERPFLPFPGRPLPGTEFAGFRPSDKPTTQAAAGGGR
jgi:hypothetical protein